MVVFPRFHTLQTSVATPHCKWSSRWWLNFVDVSLGFTLVWFLRCWLLDEKASDWNSITEIDEKNHPPSLWRSKPSTAFKEVVQVCDLYGVDVLINLPSIQKEANPMDKYCFHGCLCHQRCCTSLDVFQSFLDIYAERVWARGTLHWIRKSKQIRWRFPVMKLRTAFAASAYDELYSGDPSPSSLMVGMGYHRSSPCYEDDHRFLDHFGQHR